MYLFIFNLILHILFPLIAVKIVPHSIKHSDPVDCESQIPLELPSNELQSGQRFEVIYTYSVKYVVGL